MLKFRWFFSQREFNKISFRSLLLQHHFKNAIIEFFQFNLTAFIIVEIKRPFSFTLEVALHKYINNMLYITLFGITFNASFNNNNYNKKIKFLLEQFRLV